MNYSDYNARVNGRYEKIWQNTGKCVFCDLRDKYIIQEINNIVLTVALFPYINGHLLIIPRRHFERMSDLNAKEWATTLRLARIGEKLLEEEIGVKNGVVFEFRMAQSYQAGKSVAHAHAHLIPFSVKLFAYDYQNITISPIDLATKLRKAI